ncbi:DNA-binding response regulator [Paenibacillus sp. FSL H8-0548]|uniref:hypothetical protein n=1 Tax=Paenibacillus sp. FSL H8-0548 TaxID=1920422 RepID=UPI0009FAC41F|nr:hypothetical protein [Paenibacillus sp. FSL H8-0548]
MVNQQPSDLVKDNTTNRALLVEQAYKNWIITHIELREADSERRRRLVDRDDHGEQLFATLIWWPILGSFEHLHPEYEVNDYRDGSRFLDFTYIRSPHQISIEIDGYGPHQKHASRRKFSDDRFRQNQLILDDWIVVRFSYDDIRERPRQCQQFIQQLLGKLYGIGRVDALELQLSATARELLRWAKRLEREATFGPKDVEKQLRISHCTALKYLQLLLQHKLIEQASGKQRIRSYRLTALAARTVL